MNNIKIKGVNYDAGVGLLSIPGTGYELSESEMSEAMRVIKEELYCNAVRIYGRDLEKLIQCSHSAIREGLMVWFSPRGINASPDETIQYIIKCAIAAEELRKISPDLVYVIGNEFTLDIKGLIEGDTIYKRISALSGFASIMKNLFCPGLNKKLNDYIEKAVKAARRYFKGDITYASGQWEKVNWELFDIIGINYYRNKFNAWKYKWTVRKYVHKKKKFAVTEFGCCSYKGADKEGAWGYSMIDWGKYPPQLKEICKRDENVQANYLVELLNIYSNEKVYAAFIYTYVARLARYNTDPLKDLDMANFGLIKVLHSDGQDSNIPYLWERKKAFYKVAEFFSKN